MIYVHDGIYKTLFGRLTQKGVSATSIRGDPKDVDAAGADHHRCRSDSVILFTENR